MGIYLPNMEMPKSCANCFAYKPTAFSNCGINNRQYNWSFDRPIDCPLVPVPPHGRLIDADALEDEGADVHEDVMCCGYVEDAIWGFSYDMIDNAPTIIEAEGKRE